MYQTVGSAEGTSPTVFKVQVEQFRFIAYMAFWGMCIFAMVVSTFTVAPNLGPCPVAEGDEPTYGMHCSVLMATFGFNNVSNSSSRFISLVFSLWQSVLFVPYRF